MQSAFPSAAKRHQQVAQGHPAAKRRERIAQGASPGFAISGNASPERAADAGAAALSGLCARPPIDPALTRWAIFLRRFAAFSLGVVLLFLVIPFAFAQKPATEADPFTLTARSANVAQPGAPVKVVVFRWSSEEERNRIVLPLDPAAQAAAQAAAAAEGRGRGGRGTRGQAGAAELDPNDPALAEVIARGRGARGRGDAAAKPPDPISEFTAAVGKAPTVGYVWTDEVVGYSIKYARRIPLPAGGERIIIATDRRLGAGTAGWKPTTGIATDYEFTVIEIHVDSKGLGEGKASLATKVILDNETRTPALEGYAAAPAILQNVKH